LFFIYSFENKKRIKDNKKKSPGAPIFFICILIISIFWNANKNGAPVFLVFFIFNHLWKNKKVDQKDGI